MWHTVEGRQPSSRDVSTPMHSPQGLLQFVLGALLNTSSTGAFATDGPIAPTVRLDAATVVGSQNGSVDSFLGIPFAQPPVGNLRLRLPELLTSYNGTVNATAFGNQCIQQMPATIDAPPELLQDVTKFYSEARFGPDFGVPHSEDCLYLNVIRPANISVGANLPVLAWIYGGGFAVGSNAMENLNGSAIVQRSIDIGEPIIYVAMNYRVNVFGFLGGQEVKEEGVGNLGLQDQRAGLRWINKFISSFGGDPTKVTIWGQSAGSISVALQMLHNDGDPEGLFRAGIMNSGSLIYTKDVTELQDTYDLVVDQVGCSGASDSLACLRTVSTESLVAAANTSQNRYTDHTWLVNPYMPRADGRFLKRPIPELVLNGKLAKIPFIIGDVKDEGTLFSIAATKVTTDDEFTKHIQTWFPNASPADLQPILEAYSSDPARGSPFDTGDAYAFASQYKRVSALQGDWFFDAPRRVLLDKYSSTQPTYNFLSNRGNYGSIGVVHGTDVTVAYEPGDMTDYFIRFVNDLNPNAENGVQWPEYDAAARSSLEFRDGDTPLRIIPDDARAEAMSIVSALSLRFPF
ncbi:carotenoid ester lipase precursor [Fomes fomentarius]|nr:carotenoid ester lipase precursor [Fomes fomentarius]